MEKLTEGYGLVEGPVWDASLGLIFSDVLNGGVYSVSDNGEVATIFEHRRGIGGMSRHESNGLVVSGRNIAFKPFDGGETITLLDKDESAGIVGYNDITSDAKGRIYVGSLGSSPVFKDGREPQAGNLYMIDIDGTVLKVADDVMLTNGLGFSPDGHTLYHSDSTRRTVYSYAVNTDGTLGDKRNFITTDKGAPDGLVVSEDGRVWVALAGGGHGVGVYNADGTQSEFIEIPQPMCTSVCFGGDDLKTLYIVTGSDGMDSDHAGAVYKVRTDVAGLVVGAARVRLGA
ncbi:MAG: SMP-30/gluconolactonase/LRE family protein [Pseudomonadales bacterium]